MKTMFFKPNEKQNPRKKYIAVWLDPDHAMRLEEIAKNTNTRRNEIVRQMIAFALENMGTDHA